MNNEHHSSFLINQNCCLRDLLNYEYSTIYNNREKFC